MARMFAPACLIMISIAGCANRSGWGFPWGSAVGVGVKNYVDIGAGDSVSGKALAAGSSDERPPAA